MMSTITRELSTAWQRFNHALFGGLLRPLPIEIIDQSTLGLYRSRPRGIRLSWSLVVDAPWCAVVEVLKHEMAHQYVHEVLRVRDETAHGPTFRKVCADRAIDAAAAGMPVQGATEEPPLVRRIRKLLALAESPNEHEARAAMNLAMRLMAEHGVEVAEAAEVPRYTARQVGTIKARRPKHEQLLAGLLTSHFGVSGIWVPAYDVARDVSGKALEIAGTSENVAVAEYVHAYVLATAERFWQRHRRAQRIRGNKERRVFLEGVVLGFLEKLEAEAGRIQQEGLVLRKDPELQRWFGQRYPARRAGRRMRLKTGATHQAGKSAGRNLTVRRAVKARRARGQALLGGPSAEG
jgi:hypothetical protein